MENDLDTSIAIAKREIKRNEQYLTDAMHRVRYACAEMSRWTEILAELESGKDGS